METKIFLLIPQPLIQSPRTQQVSFNLEDAVLAPPQILLEVWNTHSSSCQYYLLKAHSCIPPLELHLTEGKCFIQGYALISRNSLHPMTG